MTESHKYIDIFLESALPGDIRDIITFAREEIVLYEGARKDQKYDPDYCPFNKLVLRALENKDNLYRQAAIIAPAQSGKTLITQGIKALYDTGEKRISLGYGGPTDDTVVASWNSNLKPLIAKSRYKDLFPSSGAGSKGGNAQNMYLTNGVNIYFFGAGGSDAQRSGKTVQNVIITEVDKMDEPGQTSRETDPVRQIIARTFAHGDNTFVILECTVSTEEGRIWLEYWERGSGGRVFIRCPHCLHWIYPEREYFVGWQEAENVQQAAKQARYACQKCGTLWDESDRLKAQQEPVIIHKNQEIDSDGNITGPEPHEWTNKLGIRWNWMCVHPEMVPMKQIAAQEWECANTDPDSRDRRNQEKDLAQFRWAVPYELKDESRKLTLKAINSHASDYDKGTVPHHVQFTTGAIDIQKRWCYWTVYGYRVADGGMTTWFIDYGIERFLPDGQDDRDPTEGQVKNGLDRAREMVNSLNPRPVHLGVDVNYYTELVTRWVSERGANLRPLIGRGVHQFGAMAKGAKKGKGLKVPGGCSHFADPRQQPDGHTIMFFDVDQLKGDFQDRFFVPTGENGCIYLPSQIADFGTYGRHLIGEYRETNWEPGKGWKTRWIQSRRRNDLLDCSAYCDGFAQLHAAKYRQEVKEKKEQHRRTVKSKKRKRIKRGTGIRTNY